MLTQTDTGLMWWGSPPVLLKLMADGAMVLACVLVPLGVWLAPRLRRMVRLRRLLPPLTLFFAALGLAGILNVLDLWWPLGALPDLFQLAAALVGLFVAFGLSPWAVRLRSDFSNWFRSAAETDEKVRRIHRRLKQRVRERAHQLERMNASLAEEIGRRSQIEQALLYANREALAARDAAQRADEAKSRFLASASHDLRQPFQALRLFLDLLELNTPSGPNRPLVENALTALGAGEDLLRSLLDISSLQAGTIHVNRARFKLADVLDRIGRDWVGQAASKGIELKILPADLTVASDPVLLKRMIDNLVANAVRYTASGRVLVGCRRTAEGARIEVWDTGPGIPSEAFDEIFDEFIQLGNPERDRTKGLGLGLSIAQGIGRLLDLDVTVGSTYGKGSVFRIQHLKIVPAHSEAAATAGSQAIALALPEKGCVPSRVRERSAA